MHPVFNAGPGQQFILSDEFPQNFQGVQLQRSAVTTGHSPVLGTVILQRVSGRQFHMLFSTFNIKQPCRLLAEQEPGFLISLLALSNVARFSFRQLNPLVLQQGQFVCMHSNPQEVVIEFEKAGIYQLLEISWSELAITELLPSFALLRPLQEAKNLRRSFFITAFNITAGFRTLGMAHGILRFPHKDANAVYLFEHKVKEYLLQLLIAAEKLPRAATHINTADLARLQVVYERLRQHPEQKFPINALARELNMSEKKLKKLFVQAFGMPIFECHLESRMKEAHRLLEEAQHNTKQIAAMVGYRLTTSFITKFREFFGYPPSGVRRKA